MQPLEVDTLITTSGERYDFVINAIQPNEQANYWIKLRAIGPCSSRKVEQFAILSYENVENWEILGRELELPAFDDNLENKRVCFNPSYDYLFDKILIISSTAPQSPQRNM